MTRRNPQTILLGRPLPHVTVRLVAAAPAVLVYFALAAAIAFADTFPGGASLSCAVAFFATLLVLFLTSAWGVIHRARDLFRIEAETDDAVARLRPAAVRILTERPGAQCVEFRVRYDMLMLFVDSAHDGTLESAFVGATTQGSNPLTTEAEHAADVVRRKPPRLRAVPNSRHGVLGTHLRALKLFPETLRHAPQSSFRQEHDARALKLFDTETTLIFHRPTAHEIARFASAGSRTAGRRSEKADNI